MGDNLKANYFILVRIILMLAFCFYGLMDKANDTGVSVRVLLLVSFIIALMALREFAKKERQLFFLIAMAIAIGVLVGLEGSSFVLLLYFIAFELLAWFGVKLRWYFLAYLLIFLKGDEEMLTHFIIITMMIVCYTQHQFVFLSMQKQLLLDTISGQQLKRDIENKEYKVQADLSQALHDKLGHSINGSIYQLEASKVLISKDPDRAGDIIQKVIDNLRTGMDEIRAILRKERPEKKKMALLQLHELMADCNDKGVAAELVTEGDLSVIPNNIWEVILDNAFEAVTNSMKYSKCKRIDVNLVVMNKMIRCSISDDGVGCENIVDGMGISGMRSRVRSVGGSIDFEAEAGFKVSMLLPI
ncbi:MAG: hypothetical protein J5537_10110 [Lachnospiraceae bacterium]|nr:hypothetical protein [Lachnospiraceae bacterium]